MLISIIAAVAENGVIGKNGALPWRLPADLARFKELTKGKAVIMGRKTYESIGKPLPDRINIVVTGDGAYQAPGCEVVASIEDVLALAKTDEVFCIGGADLYRQFLTRANKMYITQIHESFDGDTKFPDVSWEEWQEVSRTEGVADEKNPHAHTFVVYERKTMRKED